VTPAYACLMAGSWIEERPRSQTRQASLIALAIAVSPRSMPRVARVTRDSLRVSLCSFAISAVILSRRPRLPLRASHTRVNRRSDHLDRFKL